MGTCYYIACKNCREYRDLDKFYSAYPVHTRKEALEYEEVVKEKPFRFGLAVSFLAEHQGHDCVFFSEHAEEMMDLLEFMAEVAENPGGYREVVDLWVEPKGQE